MMRFLTATLVCWLCQLSAVEVIPSAKDMGLIQDILEQVQSADLAKFHQLASEELQAVVTQEVLTTVSKSFNGVASQKGARIEWLGVFERSPGRLHMVKVSAPGTTEPILVEVYIAAGLVGGLFIKPGGQNADGAEDF